MHRFLNRVVVTNTTFGNIQKSYNGKLWKDGVRSVTSQSSKTESLFPERVDFPSRHIGPRDQDIVTMLDLLGYKVCTYLLV